MEYNTSALDDNNVNNPDQGPHILLVEDDLELAQLIHDYLVKNQYKVSVVHNGLQAAKDIVLKQPDLVILDVMLPGMSGMDVCKEVRPSYSGLILMLTALDEDMDQMLGLELGADDYIIKPVQPRLLLSRIRALLRRQRPVANAIESNHASPSTEELGLHISLKDRSITLNNQTIELTTAEFDLLLLLAKSAGEVVDRDHIVESLRGFEYDGLDRSIDRRISRLRKKLQLSTNGSEAIKTVRGKGYQLCLSTTVTGGTS
jgi:two-component system OmpR family response regulator/two-component system response regulator RstA